MIAEKANALTGNPAVAPASSEGIDSSIHHKSGATPMVPQNQIVPQTNQLGRRYVPFVLTTNLPGEPPKFLTHLDINIHGGHIMPEWQADLFAPDIVQLLLSIAESSTDRNVSEAREYARDDADERIATRVISEVKRKGVWFGGATGLDGYQEVWFAPSQLLPNIYCNRDRVEDALRESMDEMEDSLSLSVIGADDLMFDDSYPLADGRRKPLGDWNIADWQGAFTEPYRSAATDAESADQFHEQVEKFIQAMTQRNVGSTRELFGRDA